MISLPTWSRDVNTAFFLTQAIRGALGGTALLLAITLVRHGARRLRNRRYEALTFKIRGQWREIVKGNLPPDSWRKDPIGREIVQSIVIREISAAADKDRPGLQEFLRTSGLLELCIEKAQTAGGWRRREALLALGAMRVPEAIDPLSDAMDDWRLDTRMAAVRALGLTRLPQAAAPMIESLMVGGLRVRSEPVINALICRFMDRPDALLRYLRRACGDSRELLARVASEVASPGMADEMIVLAGDLRPEVRASAARALSAAPLPLAIPALADLARDEVWFVRLRAATALDQIRHPRAIPTLLEAIRDPNRLVRLRAAAALARFELDRIEILKSIVESRDRYALHAMISALELGGGVGKVMEELSDPRRHDQAAARLLQALRDGAAGLWSTRPADPVVETVFP
jgi:HEAT repeat protein